MKIRQNSKPLRLTIAEEKEIKDYGRNQETKFDLYVQSRRVKQISTALDRMAINSQQLESLNVIQDQEFVSDILDELLDDSILVLDGIQLDGESLDLSLKMMNNIKRAIGVLQQVASDRQGQVN